MTFAAFEQHMNRLAGLKFSPKNLQTHWEALRDLHDDELIDAISRAQREVDEFPSPKRLREFVDEFRARPVIPEAVERSVPAPETTFTVPVTGQEIRVTRYWRYYCDTCSDTGWRAWWCGSGPPLKPWLDRGSCGRRKDHGPHEYVTPCPCAESNPDVQRSRARLCETTRTKATS